MATIHAETSTVDRDVGKRISFLRETSGYQIELCAALIGAAVHELRDYEAGLRRAPAARLAALSKLLSVPVGTFFGF